MINQTVKSIKVFDKATDTFYPVQGEDTLVDIVRFYVGVPYRGDLFNLVEETVTGQMGKMRLAGSDQLTDVFRPDRKTLQRKVLEIWRWTGKYWKQLCSNSPQPWARRETV